MTSRLAGESPAHAVAGLTRSQLLAAFGTVAILSVALGQFSWGGKVIYPFRLVATWAHEMGHGIGGLITGNRFEGLEIYRSLGGQALIGGADGLSQVVVSSLGLIGPALLGSVVMIAGSRAATAPYVLAVLAAAIGVSTLLWIDNGFGLVAMVSIAAALGAVARFGPPLLRVAVAQLLAIQMALAAWSSRDYLFTAGFERDGRRLASDTENIASELFLPYWFWGGLLGGLSVLILAWAFWFAWLRPAQPADAAT